MTPEYVITEDPALIDAEVVHRWLSEESYWARGRTLQVVERSMTNSICLGALHDGRLVGIARVVSDMATFAWLCDVFVVAEHRGRGVGGALVAAAVDHPKLRGLKRFVLATADAHELYRRHGFEILDHPERWMIRRGPGA